jgi:hypothetical protein
MFLAPLAGRQNRPASADVLSTDAVLKLLPQGGVYVDSPLATPRLVQIKPAAAREVSVKVKRDPVPITAQYAGASATVRVTAADPVFYVFKEASDAFRSKKDNKADVWSVKLTTVGDTRELHLGTARPDGHGGSTVAVQLREAASSMVVEPLGSDLYRVTSPSPLPPGEYALTSAGIFVELVDKFVMRPFGGSIKLQTPIFDFVVEVK